MIIYTDEKCLSYHAVGHPERPSRVEATTAWLKKRYPHWNWNGVAPAPVSSLLRAHSQAHLDRLQEERDFDADTAFHEGIYEIARIATGGTLAAMESAMRGAKAFSLMRPPGHHAERSRAMGFCYLNHIGIAVLEALSRSVGRVAVWDFDAHHGNGTEAILGGLDDVLYVSVHQHPCYPGTGLASRGNAVNFQVAPGTDAKRHVEVLGQSWQAVLKFAPKLVLVSAGFDAYEKDPLTQMRLGVSDFETLGAWIADANLPTAATLEGGYSDDLPLLVEAFLKGWSRS